MKGSNPCASAFKWIIYWSPSRDLSFFHEIIFFVIFLEKLFYLERCNYEYFVKR